MRMAVCSRGFRIGLGTFGMVLMALHTCSAQMTNNVLERVLHLRVNANMPNQGTATGFTIAVDGREYLITAKHVVTGLGDQGVVGIDQNGVWHDLSFQILRCDDPIDIAVLVPPQQLTVDFAVPAEDYRTIVGSKRTF